MTKFIYGRSTQDSPDFVNAADETVSFESMRGHMARGAAWMVAMRWAMRLFGLISTIILARLLTPADYGVVAMAMVVVGLVQVFTFTTFDLALIQRVGIDRTYFDTAWTLQVIQGTALAAIILIIAPLGAAYFREPRVGTVIQVLAVSAFIQGFANIGTVTFRKDLNFSMEFRFNIFCRLLGFITVVALAFYLRNYWALAFGTLSTAIISVLMSYLMHPYRPRLSLARVREIWSFSQWMLVFLVGTYFKNKLDAFVVGRVAGVSEMGSYHIASELSAMATNEVVMPMGRALFPAYAKLAKNQGEARHAFENVFALMVFFCLPIGFGFSAVADDAVTVVLGAKWAVAAPLIQWLAIGAVMSGLTHAAGIFMSATGQARTNALTIWANLIILIPAIWIGQRYWNIIGIAAARTIVALAFLGVLLAILSHVHAVRLRLLWRSVWRSIVATILMVILVSHVSYAGIDTPAGRLILAVAGGATVFCITVYQLWRFSGRPVGAEKALLDAFTSVWTRLMVRSVTKP